MFRDRLAALFNARTRFALLGVATAFMVALVYNFIERLGTTPTPTILTLAAIISVVAVFIGGAAGLLTDTPLPKRTSEPADLTKIRQELNQLRQLEVPGLIRERVNAATEEIAKSLEAAGRLVDLSDPNKIFSASRDRLILDSQRIDRISRRNLYFGIVFSAFALGALAWPLLAQSLNLTKLPEIGTGTSEIFRWFAETYLPRFAVALLLQFVGFFFLRLYVANELDLKHNRNELTNLDMKMMALQLATDQASKKEIVKTFWKTERNFVIKKNEKLISGENAAEYNDMKSLLEKVIQKLPTIKAQ
jgi:hypothetical protein